MHLIHIPKSYHVLFPCLRCFILYSAVLCVRTVCVFSQDHNLTADQTKTLVVADAEVLSSKIDNLINLNDLTEEAILHNLRIRFKVREVRWRVMLRI